MPGPSPSPAVTSPRRPPWGDTARGADSPPAMPGRDLATPDRDGRCCTDTPRRPASVSAGYAEQPVSGAAGRMGAGRRRAEVAAERTSANSTIAPWSPCCWPRPGCVSAPSSSPCWRRARPRVWPSPANRRAWRRGHVGEPMPRRAGGRRLPRAHQRTFARMRAISSAEKARSVSLRRLPCRAVLRMNAWAVSSSGQVVTAIRS